MQNMTLNIDSKLHYMCFTRITTQDQSVISKMLQALNLKNNAETRYRCQVSVYRTIGPLVSSFNRIIEKTCFWICENKGADQLLCNLAADQHLCFLLHR